jgi:hypothetical protein
MAFLGVFVGQLGDIHGYTAGFAAREQFQCRAAARLIIKINIGQIQPSAILHDKTSTMFFGPPGRGKAALGHDRALADLLVVILSKLQTRTATGLRARIQQRRGRIETVLSIKQALSAHPKTFWLVHLLSSVEHFAKRYLASK